MKRRLLLAPLAALLFAGPASAAWFLKIEGVEGESTDARHRGWIEVQSLSMGSLGQTQPGDPRLKSSRVRFNSFSITRKNDKSSPVLFLKSANKATFPGATLDACQLGSSPCTRYVLQNVQVGDVKRAGHGALGEIEEIAFTFHKIEIQKSDGKTMGIDDWNPDLLQKPSPTATPAPTRGTVKPR